MLNKNKASNWKKEISNEKRKKVSSCSKPNYQLRIQHSKQPDMFVVDDDINKSTINLSELAG